VSGRIDTVKVSAHDLHRLLLEFRAQIERGKHAPGGYLGGWHHAVDYDRSFERLADIVDAHLVAAGDEPDPRTRCQQDNPVYRWPDSPQSVTWTDVESGAIIGDAGPRLRHLAAADGRGRFTTLCGFTFVDEDIAEPGVSYRRCGVCVREQRLRGNVNVVEREGGEVISE
jgi:hypothetical protein